MVNFQRLRIILKMKFVFFVSLFISKLLVDSKYFLVVHKPLVHIDVKLSPVDKRLVKILHQ